MDSVPRDHAVGVSPGQLTAWKLAVLLALVVLGAAAWFVGLQIVVIGAFCPYCMTAHGCGALAALLILGQAPFGARSSSRSQETDAVLTRRTAGQLAAMAGAVVALLVVGQVVHQPKTFAVRSLPSTLVVPASTQPGGTPGQAGVRPGGTSVAVLRGPATVGTAPRLFGLYGGAVQFDLREVPLYGSADAPHVLVSVFDYTCSHCREIHPFLMEAHRALSNRLAIVSLPTPLDRDCNPHVKRRVPEQTNGCRYARIGLAVWRARPGQLEAFDDWMFSFPRPPGVDEARQHATELVGTNAFAEASRDPWIQTQLDQDFRLYRTNYDRFRIGRLPQLIVGTNLVSGTFRNVQDLYSLLERHLGVSVPMPSPP